MASPRRSNRGGHSKGRGKKEEDDDGGQTRCVCNQQHHEGVMIQCETCKVWQHCPCVGLGDGEVTPDKYYCDSCRPENHPYRVQNGQLITNTKPNSSQKPTKKRSTMNSKEASIPVDLMLAQQKWNEEHQDEIEDDITHRASSKRRRKTESITTDIDEEHTEPSKDSGTPSSSSAWSGTEKKKNGDYKDRTGSGATEQDVKTPVSNSSRSSGKKSAAKSASKAGSRSSSPVANGVESRVSSPQDGSLSPTPAKAEGSSPKNGRSHEDDETKNDASSNNIVPATKRRKTGAKSEMPSRSDSASADDQEESSSKKEANMERSDAPARSRKNGNSRNSTKKSSASMDEEPAREESATPSGNSASHQQVPSVSSPASGKKPFPRRGGDRQSMRTGSRHSTPAPNQTEGTPQPLPPVAPATVQYPSPKMTIQDMTKRAKQLLDYISRVQIDMADRKSKSGSNSPQEGTSATPKMSGSGITPTSTHSQQPHPETKERTTKEDFAAFRFPAPALVSTATMHGDSQVCPDLSRSSMDSTSSTMDHEPSSPLDVKVPSKDSNSKEMTIKVVPMSGQESSPLLSTPPLSVHDHHDHHRHQQHRSGSPESETTHEPLTPPHQPSEGDKQQEQDQGSSSTTTADVDEAKKDSTAITSLELMDKLTGDLIRFQEKFGAYT